MTEFSSFDELFRAATGYAPYPYQRRFAIVDPLPELLKVPTGAGKTATAILGWLWRRRFASDDIIKKTPRRLVYCLPMRNLVEQTYEEAIKWLFNLDLLAGEAEFNGNRLVKYHPTIEEGLDGKIPVYMVMGGEVETEWDAYPENDAIIIGTQDMLLSRALNRGYAMSRFRWPLHFALLNNDVMWVLDEVQLMNSGLPTSAQLDAFRKIFGTFGPSHTLWMSATCEPAWISTPDRSPPEEGRTLVLNREDKEKEPLKSRLHAHKEIEFTHFKLEGVNKKDIQAYSENVATLLEKEAQNHASSRPPLILIIINTIERAQELYLVLKKKFKDIDVRLIHSGFRPEDKKRLLKILKERPDNEEFPKHGRIIVSTQVVEAGVDISSSLLLTELAPWASVVQRLGRLNRRGEYKRSKCIVLDFNLDVKNAELIALPYDLKSLKESREILKSLTLASPTELEEVPYNISYQPEYVLRRRDLIELYDTTPDLTGKDIDVSRYVRDIQEKDVYVFWRNWGDKDSAPPSDLPAPQREELCSASITSFRNFIANRKAWYWDHLAGEWASARENKIVPGRIFLLHTDSGGYSAELGWRADLKKPVELVEISERASSDYMDDDAKSRGEKWVSLEEHAEETESAMEKLLSRLSHVVGEEYHDILRMGAMLHDLGKAHPIFQKAIGRESPDTTKLWAKAPHSGPIRYERKHFRHELVSSLIILQNRDLLTGFSSSLVDLISYLVGAHHGKVRMAIRSYPDEEPPEAAGEDPIREKRYALGVLEGDVVPPIKLRSFSFPETEIDLTIMEIGSTEDNPSWIERTTQLRDGLGIFKLGYLESLVRIADWRASSTDYKWG